MSGNRPTEDSRSDLQANKMRRKGSVSDAGLNSILLRKGPPQSMEIQDLIRVCGKSILYLPPGYSPGGRGLLLPTCIRATAHYLLHHVDDLRGIFRVPGSVRVVGALFDYYCYTGDDRGFIAGTVRCATLPVHLKASAHDVASTFKRFLSVLPGGILGSLSVLDTLVAINSQLPDDEQATRGRHGRLRAKLIALAIGAIPSHLRRSLLCAVFGMLSFLSHPAETNLQRNRSGGRVAISGLMGYDALGIVFGPLLVGDMLDSYTTKLEAPSSGLALYPITPPMSRKERQKRDQQTKALGGPLTIDKIWVANKIASMLIRHWKEVVQCLGSLDLLRPDGRIEDRRELSSRPSLPTSLSEPFVSNGRGLRKRLRDSSVNGTRNDSSSEPHLSEDHICFSKCK